MRMVYADQMVGCPREPHDMTLSSSHRHTADMPAHAALPRLAAPLLDEAICCAGRVAAAGEPDGGPNGAVDGNADSHADSNANGDPELIHRYRVSLRQLRCLLWAYAPLLPAGMAHAWRTRLGTLADLAGPAREWAVLATELAPHFLPEDTARAQPLLRALEQQVARETAACRRAMRDAAPAAVLSSLRATLADWSAVQDRSPPLDAFARQRLRDAYRILRQRAARAAADADAEAVAKAETGTRTLHRTRIAIKRVHYLTVLFAPTLARPAARQVKWLRRLQLHLGRANDTTVALMLLDPSAPRLCGRHLRRLVRGRLLCLNSRYEAQARRALARARKRLKP